jgi:hypothetical protein
MPITSALTATAAAALREQLQQLERERATAALAGLTTNELYITDLRTEIEATRNAYVGAAVTEIASLRAALDGPLRG